MNKVVLMGRLTKDVETRYTSEGLAVSRYSLAVDRPGKDKGADFINCVAFGKVGEFAEKYLAKGTKVAIVGRIQTGSFENKEGKKVYTTDVVVESHYFCESRGGEKPHNITAPNEPNDEMPPGFESIDEDDMPF